MSSGLSRQILQDRVIQHGVCQERRQFCGLTVQRFAAVGVGQVHATVFGFELLEQRGVQAMCATHLSRRHSSFLFFDHPDYLGFGKAPVSHLFAPSKVEQLYIRRLRNGVFVFQDLIRRVFQSAAISAD